MLDQSGNFMLVYMNMLPMHPGKGALSRHNDASPCGHLHMPVDLQSSIGKNDTEEKMSMLDVSKRWPLPSVSAIMASQQ
jgi:hypothetical protein